MTVSNRRWLRFSLLEIFILMTIMGILWWRLTSWTTTIDVAPGEQVETPFGVVSFETAAIVTRGPLLRELAWRGIVSSAVLIAVWIIGREAIRRFRGSTCIPSDRGQHSP
jgi:hypothetical protein